MEQLVKVLTAEPDGTAQVIHVRQSACSGDCHKCSGCGAAQQTMHLTARNPIGAVPGDLVVIEAGSGPVLAAAAVLYLLPLGLFFAGYLAGHLLWQQGAAAGCVAFAVGLGIAWLYDRQVARKQKTVYTITGYGHGVCNTEEKGDNDLD